MTRLSSDTLFHFTDSIENIVSILEHEFQPRYSLEYFTVVGDGNTTRIEGIGVPMVSFCDIPLSQAGPHMGKYGEYAIGLRKDWGIRNGVTPVLYAHANSATVRAISGMMFHQYGGVRDQDTISTYVASLALLLKPYEGPMNRRGQRIDSVRFYDEREWRFVPQFRRGWGVLKEAEYENSASRDAANVNVGANNCLSFEPPDIRYIVVRTETEMLSMINAVMRVKSPKYTDEQVKVLASRIVAAEQIAADF